MESARIKRMSENELSSSEERLSSDSDSVKGANSESEESSRSVSSERAVRWAISPLCRASEELEGNPVNEESENNSCAPVINKLIAAPI